MNYEQSLEETRIRKLYLKWINDMLKRTYTWHNFYFCKDRCKYCPYFMKTGEQLPDWECPYLDLDYIGLR